jgi:diguanylate cyclase (GGDEF)-like protein
VKLVIGESSQLVRSVIVNAVQDLGHEAMGVADGNEVWAELSAGEHPDVAIVSWELAGITGPELCTRVRALDRGSYTYVILLTARDDADDIAHGLKAGADDYMTKPFNPTELLGRLAVAERVIGFANALQDANTRLDRLASIDSLTGITNRRVILERLEQAISSAISERGPAAALMVDVDRFKRFNDSYGHKAGDAVLAAAAGTLEEAVGNRGHVGRYGGEEFLVVLPGADPDAAAAMAERVRAAVECMIVSYGAVFSVTASIGAANLPPAAGVSADGLLYAADVALYRAKAGGRNRVEVASVADFLTDPAAAFAHDA